MKIDKETALSLWERNYGRDVRADDYAGRPMDKAAYGDRNSDYGWNIDHICPVSKGGKTVPNNLICCNIQTNDEKADKFPAFKAHGQIFNIVRVQNHYEIKKKNEVQEHGSYFDAAYGIRRVEQALNEQDHYVSIDENPTIKVTILVITFDRRIPKQFIQDLFPASDIRQTKVANNEACIIELRGNDQPLFQSALESCIMLNTYMGHYFLAEGFVQRYSIFCFPEEHEPSSVFEDARLSNFIPGSSRERPMKISEEIFDNTDAYDVFKRNPAEWEIRGSMYQRIDRYDFIDYDVVYPKLAKNIDRILNEQ